MNEQVNQELNEESIEILELDDDSLDTPTVRKSFRIPIRGKGKFLIIINGVSFPIEDINLKGAGVLMVEDLSFFKGQLLSGCELIFENEKFIEVECQIVHITCIKDSPPLLGIKWLNMESKTSVDGNKIIKEICDELKNDLLNDNNEDLQD